MGRGGAELRIYALPRNVDTAAEVQTIELLSVPLHHLQDRCAVDMCLLSRTEVQMHTAKAEGLDKSTVCVTAEGNP